MADSRSPVADAPEAGTLLDPYLKGQRGAQLRSQLITLHPDASPTEIDEAIQIACDRFLTKADGITEHGQVYTWLRITAHRELLREDDRRKRLIVVDPAKTLAAVPADEFDPEAEANRGPCLVHDLDEIALHDANRA